MPHFVYNDLDMGTWDEHVFPAEKYVLTKKNLLAFGVPEDEFTSSEEATLDEIRTVHSHTFLSRIEDYAFRNPFEAVREFEAPCNHEVYDSFKLMCGASIRACKLALETKSFGFHVGGGFHHAFDNHGEGFCILNDIAVAIRVLQKEKLVEKVAVIDVDVHQGNGTAYIFENDKNVFTFSIHNDLLYPMVKMKSDLDIGLLPGTKDTQYNKHLFENVPKILDSHKPDLLIYVAGADTYIEDKIGGLHLSIEGCNKRDEIVISEATKRNIPTMVCLAGGYANKTDDVATIHFNCAKTCIEKYGMKF
ncbi:MAG: histone deacetylase [Planctomycetes bacterium]|nr:histone deacetylase [Planctomycetota bacterium]